jgi:hypothetical protein
MNLENYEEVAYGHDLDLLLISRQSHASYPMSSRRKIEKSVNEWCHDSQ